MASATVTTTNNNNNNNRNKECDSPDMIMSSMTLEQFERELAVNSESNGFKKNLDQTVNDLKERILPLRLKFNQFLTLMATLDQNQNNLPESGVMTELLGCEKEKESGKMKGNDIKIEETKNNMMSPKDNFNLIKTQLIDLYDNIQQYSKDFQTLDNLFSCIAEYSETNKTKQYAPLECLSIDYSNKIKTIVNSNNSDSTTLGSKASVPTGTTITQLKKNDNSINNKTLQQNNSNSPMTNVISSNSNKNNAGSTSNSSANTPSSTTITSTTTTTNNNNSGSSNAGNNNVPNPATKKPRKPRQSKKASNTTNSQISTPQNGNIPTNRNNMNTINKAQQRIMQSPLITTNQNIPLQTMNIGQGTMNPSNMLGITPTANNSSTTNINSTTNASAAILSPANVLNNAMLNLNTGNNLINNNNTNNNMLNTMNTPNGNMSSINQNNLTPANILSMSNVNINNMNSINTMNTMSSINQMTNMNNNNGNSNTNINNNNNNNSNDLTNIDLNSFDLSNLNMDFI